MQPVAGKFQSECLHPTHPCALRIGLLGLVLVVNPLGRRIDGYPSSNNHHTQNDHANDGDEHSSMVPYRHETAFNNFIARGLLADGCRRHRKVEFRH